MTRDKAYRKAEQWIESAQQVGVTQLNLSLMNLTELPESLGKLSQLQYLDISDNQLTTLPESLGKLSQLQYLDISDNQLTTLPESLDDLSQLQKLNLRNNQLTTLPESLGNLSQLQYLNLRTNQLTTLPESLGNLSQLQYLNLTVNPLKTLPPSMAILSALQALLVGGNQIGEIPQFLGELTQLKRLYFWGNGLNTIPAWIDRLNSLEILSIHANQLTRLLDAIVNLQNLKILTLGYHKEGGNPLKSLPESIRYLSQLEKLELYKCELQFLPDWLGELGNLETLDLRGNHLTDLPASLAQLDRLEELQLEDNPLNPELAAAYEQGLDAVKAYLREKAEAQIVLNEAKLILVGEGEVGKTSLLGALRGDAWVEHRPTTHGVEVDIKSLTLVDADSGTEITLNGWDFGGQNIYRHTHQLFFTAPAIYLAVWNPRRGPAQCRVEEWLKMVKHRAYDESRPDDKPRILVVATHGGPKERLDHIDEQALREEFGDLIVGFHHIDSKTGYGLEGLEQTIAQTVARIPQVGRAVPASWKRVLDAVRDRSQTDAWITYEQFQSLCADQEVDLTLAKTYAAILNELGHLIHYGSDAVLRDIAILKPEWLSKAISFVLEDPQVKQQNGLVRHSRLGELWDDPERGADRYPQQLHAVFLKLMERCDLSYRVELPEADAPPTSLMAQLVPSRRPDEWEQDWLLRPGDTERTQICRILDAETGRTAEAEGLMYRLIVRLHRF